MTDLSVFPGNGKGKVSWRGISKNRISIILCPAGWVCCLCLSLSLSCSLYSVGVWVGRAVMCELQTGEGVMQMGLNTSDSQEHLYCSAFDLYLKMSVKYRYMCLYKPWLWGGHYSDFGIISLRKRRQIPSYLCRLNLLSPNFITVHFALH